MMQKLLLKTTALVSLVKNKSKKAKHYRTMEKNITLLTIYRVEPKLVVIAAKQKKIGTN
jgi:hypothetical protein